MSKDKNKTNDEGASEHGLRGRISRAFSSRSQMEPDMEHAEAPEDSDRLAQENLRLKRAVEELSILNELARDIGASHDSKEIMDKIVSRSLRAVQAEQGVITLLSEDDADPTKTLVRRMGTSREQQAFRPNDSLLGWMYLKKRPLVMNDAHSDERFRGVKWDESIRSILCVPLMVKSELKGVLTVFNKKDDAAFTDEDQRLLAIIAAQSAQIIENARLYEEEQALIRMKQELMLASKIQLDLLPKECPRVQGYDIAGRSVPAQEVGGDYFDFVELDDGRWGLCLGDVSGKGLPASLLMANLQATLRSQIVLDPSPLACISRTNKLIYRSTDNEKFATLFLGVLNPEKHEIIYSNAGHDYPVLLRENEDSERLKAEGTVVGFIEDYDFEEKSSPMNIGDVVVAYSDGITEAVNSEDEQFGFERLLEVLERDKKLPAGEIIENIVSAVRGHAAGTPQSDDMTVIVIKRLNS
jgi:serine phosphatase RsbU (regulator of sigma subunit)